MNNSSTRMLYCCTLQYISHKAYNTHEIAGIKSGQASTDGSMRSNKRIRKYAKKKTPDTAIISSGFPINISIFLRSFQKLGVSTYRLLLFFSSSSSVSGWCFLISSADLRCLSLGSGISITCSVTSIC